MAQVLAKSGVTVRGISRKGTPKPEATFSDYLSADPCNPNEEVVLRVCASSCLPCCWKRAFLASPTPPPAIHPACASHVLLRFLRLTACTWLCASVCPRARVCVRACVCFACAQVISRVRSASVIVSCVPPGPCVRALEALAPHMSQVCPSLYIFLAPSLSLSLFTYPQTPLSLSGWLYAKRVNRSHTQ